MVNRNTAIFLCNSCLKMFGGYGDRWCVWCRSFDYFQVDELIAPSIALLNKKGYKTINCCSGHIHDTSGYIWFDELYEFPSIPKGCKLGEHEGTSHLKWSTDGNGDTQQTISNIVQTMSNLYSWVVALPDIKKAEGGHSNLV